MPNVQKHKKYHKKYTEQDLQSAFHAIENGMSQRKAAEQFKVPRATLHFRASNKFKEKTTPGPNPILSLEEEDRLKKWIITCQNKGFPVRVEDVQDSVKGFLDANPRPTNPFTNNRPGRGWYRSFLKRHPDLSERTPEAVTAASSVVSEKDIKKWFTSVQEYLQRKGYSDVLQDPSRVLNGDETCFLLCPKNKRVLAVTGSKNVYQIEHHPKVNLTVMFTFAASGEITAPMIIYPYKRIPSNVVNSVPREWGIGCSDTGWMKNENFYEYIGNVLHKYLVAKNTKFPVILFVDGHKTHLTLQTSELCSKLKIILVALYPNATRIMQPADVAAFKPLKVNWNQAVLKFRRENPNSVVTKENFASVLKTAISQLKSNSIVSGFKATGLFPWNPEAIDYSKCLGKINSPNKNLNETICPKQSITYDDFVQIVGHEKILVFEALDNSDKLIGDSKLLFSVFKIFKNIDLPTLQPTDRDGITCNIQGVDIMTDTEDNIPVSIPLSFQISEVNDDTTNNIKHIRSVTEDTITLDIPSTSNNVSLVIQEVNSFANTSKQPLITEHASLKEINTSIEKFFFWPKTPERKGKKQSERLPFVLTSSDRQNAERRKIEEKMKQEKIKLERKQKRIETKATKNNKKSKQTKVKIIKEKVARGKAESNENQIDIKKKDDFDLTTVELVDKIGYNTEEKFVYDLNEDSRDTKKVNMPEAMAIDAHISKADTLVNQTIKSTILKGGVRVHIPEVVVNKENQEAARSQVCDSIEENIQLLEIANNTSLSPNIQKHSGDSAKRKLFSEAGDYTDSKKIFVIADIMVNQPESTNSSVKNLLYTGLCYSCLLNITKSKIGVRCQFCVRSYHISTCAKKQQETENLDNFMCTTCKKKKKVEK